MFDGPNWKLVEIEDQPTVGDHQEKLDYAADQIHYGSWYQLEKIGKGV